MNDVEAALGIVSSLVTILTAIDPIRRILIKSMSTQDRKIIKLIVKDKEHHRKIYDKYNQTTKISINAWITILISLVFVYCIPLLTLIPKVKIHYENIMTVAAITVVLGFFLYNIIHGKWIIGSIFNATVGFTIFWEASVTLDEKLALIKKIGMKLKIISDEIGWGEVEWIKNLIAIDRGNFISEQALLLQFSNWFLIIWLIIFLYSTYMCIVACLKYYKMYKEIIANTYITLQLADLKLENYPLNDFIKQKKVINIADRGRVYNLNLSNINYIEYEYRER